MVRKRVLSDTDGFSTKPWISILQAFYQIPLPKCYGHLRGWLRRICDSPILSISHSWSSNLWSGRRRTLHNRAGNATMYCSISQAPAISVAGDHHVRGGVNSRALVGRSFHRLFRTDVEILFLDQPTYASHLLFYLVAADDELIHT